MDKEILDRLDKIIAREDLLLRLHASALGIAQPSPDYKKRIDDLRGFSAYLYNFARIARTREEIRDLVKKIMPKKKNIAQYVNTYVDRLKDRNLLIDVSLVEEEYVVRLFSYDAPPSEPREVSKEEQEVEERPEGGDEPSVTHGEI